MPAYTAMPEENGRFMTESRSAARDAARAIAELRSIIAAALMAFVLPGAGSTKMPPGRDAPNRARRNFAARFFGTIRAAARVDR